MRVQTIALHLSATAAVGVIASPSHSQHHDSLVKKTTSATGINWGPCNFNGSALPIQCGSLDVPLDYLDSESSETLTLQLSRVRATKEPFLGSILFNFGGPGDEAIQTLGGRSEELISTTGGQHDLIGVDPRGLPTSIAYDCYGSPNNRTLFGATYPVTSGNASDVALGTNWANSKMFVEFCRQNTKKTAEVMGTAYVARDLMQVVEALDEDGLLRFWGMSYGTALGATVAAMFPDKIDRLVLDAVVNGHNYYHQMSLDTSQIQVVDSAIEEMLRQCAQNPNHCGFAREGASAEDLLDDLDQMLTDYKYNPVAFPSIQGIIGYSQVESTLSSLVTAPKDIRKNMEDLARYRDHQDLELMMQKSNKLSEEAKRAGIVPTDLLYAVKCGDTFARSDALEGAVMDEIHDMGNSSKWLGLTPVDITMKCGQWPFSAKERYEGGFENVETKHPVFFLANEYDGRTSPASAHNMSSGFAGSAVLVQKGFGHGSWAQPSSCTQQAVSDYFIQGELPGVGECEVDTELFLFEPTE